MFVFRDDYSVIEIQINLCGKVNILVKVNKKLTFGEIRNDEKGQPARINNTELA